jgi:hypothetical protein
VDLLKKGYKGSATGHAKERVAFKVFKMVAVIGEESYVDIN